MLERPMMDGLRENLRTEGQALEQVVVDAGPAAWDLPTPAPGWRIGHQISHLTATDEALLLALREPEEFRRRVAEEGAADPAEADRQAAAGHAAGQTRTVRRWKASRAAVLQATAGRDPRDRLPWFGPEMSLRTAVTARYMETWAHAHDVAEALAVRWPAGEGLHHVITLAVLTRDFAFSVNGHSPPSEPFRVVVTAPDGAPWSWGPAEARQSVSGVAEDLALLAVRRLHRRDARVTARGAEADRWLELVQAYAGPPGQGRRPAPLSDAGR